MTNVNTGIRRIYLLRHITSLIHVIAQPGAVAFYPSMQMPHRGIKCGCRVEVDAYFKAYTFTYKVYLFCAV